MFMVRVHVSPARVLVTYLWRSRIQGVCVHTDANAGLALKRRAES